MSNVLCFTVTYDRPYHIYNTINNILNQSFKDFNYVVRINIDNSRDQLNYELLLKDFVDDPRLTIIYGENKSQQENYLSTINDGIKNSHNIIAKIDDDDIYHKKYLETGIKLFSKSEADIISFNSHVHINNKKLFGPMNSIGMWAGDRNQKINFGMPPTYIFNRKAYDLIKNITPAEVKKIHLFEDAAWRTVWRKNGIKSIIYDDAIFTYHIHGNNVSSKFLYDNNQGSAQYLDNNYFAIYEFRHKDWQSYIYLNKRNNRVYNINNDDHGSFVRLNENIIQINWDDWGSEKFEKNKTKKFFEKIYE